MISLPALLKTHGRRAAVVGAGAGAASKTRLLLSAGLEVTVLAADFPASFSAEFAGAAALIPARGAAEIIAGFVGARIVVIAVDDAFLAAELVDAARAAGGLVNVVDRPELCDFTFPAIVDREDVVVAIGTSGAAPVLARRLKERIDALLPARLGALARFAARFRQSASNLPAKARRPFWERLFDGPIAEMVLAGDEARAEHAVGEALRAASAAPGLAQSGVIHLVGAGPGDPELLTLRALRLIGEADVILYDRLVSADILAHARRDAERIYVGKAKGAHSVPQEEIAARMIALARAGRRVVRLKGGDPFIFGRGGEELEAARAAGVPCFVTPGVTAALGAAAAAGLPLTHRDHAQAVTFVTGAARDGAAPDLNWRALADLGHTLVVYMGVGRAGDIQRELVSAGRAAATPVAIIENATRPDQRVLKGVLGGLDDLVRDSSVEGPALLVIGETAALADEVIDAIIERMAA